VVVLKEVLRKRPYIKIDNASKKIDLNELILNKLPISKQTIAV